MTIPLDECVPKKFRFELAPHVCVTVREAGFAGRKNGELLALADGKFDVLVTVDKALWHERSIKTRQIAIITIRTRSNSLMRLRPHAAACLAALREIKPGQVIEVGLV